MSFLTIAQDVAISVDFPPPTSAIGSADPAIKKIVTNCMGPYYFLISHHQVSNLNQLFLLILP